MNKKGSAKDIMFVLVALFLFAFISMLMMGVYNSYTDSIEGSEAFNNTVNNAVEESAGTTLRAFDYIFMFFLFGLIVIVIASTFTIRTHPLFFFVSLLLLIITVIIGGVFSQVFETSAETDIMQDGANEYTVIPFVMDHLPTIILMVGVILVVILYAKTKYEEV